MASMVWAITLNRMRVLVFTVALLLDGRDIAQCICMKPPQSETAMCQSSNCETESD